MKAIVLISRFGLGGIFAVLGMNAFYGFLPMPPLQGAGAAFMSALIQSGYFFPFLKSVEIACGIAIITGFFLPLALIVLLPININILLFHAFLGLDGLPLAIVLMVLHTVLIYAYRTYYKGLLVFRV